jgi:predicted branched-subunit amino acid permease
MGQLNPEIFGIEIAADAVFSVVFICKFVRKAQIMLVINLAVLLFLGS